MCNYLTNYYTPPGQQDDSINTYLFTPWSKVLLEKLTGFAASQEIPRIYGTRKFITATCPYPEPAPSSPHNPLTLPEDPS
jgi:hypothetical protein